MNFWDSLLHLTPTIDHLYLEQPQIRITRFNSKDTTRFNFSDIVEHLATQSSEQPSADVADTSSAIPAFRANAIRLSQGRFQFEDALAGANLGYQGINLQLSQLDSTAFTLSLPATEAANNNQPKLTADANRYAFSLSGDDQSQLELNGQFQLQPFELSGDVKLTRLTLPPFWPFAADSIKARLTDGNISFASHYQVKQNDQQLSFATDQGHFELANLTFSDQQTPKVKLPQLQVDGIAVTSENQSVDLQSIAMKGLWVDASFDKSGLDLQQLFTPVEQTAKASAKNTKSNQSKTEPVSETADAETQEDNAWLVRLNRFAMTDSDLNLAERSMNSGVHWRLYPLAVSTGAVLSDLSQPIDYQLSLNLSSSTKAQPKTERGQLTTSGSVDAKTMAANGKIQLSKLDLSQFQPYLEPYLNLKLAKGKLSTQGDFNADSKGKLIYQGKADIANLLIKDKLEYKPLLKWQKMDIDSLHFDQQSNQLKINTILLDAPYAKVTITEDKRTNIGEIVVASEQEQKAAQNSTPATTAKNSGAKAHKAAKPFALDIGSIKVARGSAYFADNSLKPNFASGIEALEGHISNVSSTPGTKAQVDLKGKIDRYAPVTLKGEINPLIQQPYLDLDLVFKSVELTSVNPYSGTYAGYYIDKGQLSLALNYQLVNNQLAGKNHLVIDQLQLGKPSESDLATSLPVSLAIAILQDRHGVIDLGLQVSGDVDSPDFSFGSIIINAFTNVITKAVTSPFSLLANLAGSDEELNHIQFQPGLASLDTNEQDRLSKLAKALDDRPKLKISINGSVELTGDSQALAELNVQQALLNLSGLESLPADFSASRIPASGPLVVALEGLAEQQLKLSIKEERTKIEQQLKDKAEAADVNSAQVTTVLHLGLYNQLVNAQEIDTHALSNLAEARAKAIKAYLVDKNQISPDRVFLLDSKTQLKTEDSGAKLTLSAG